jgi:hypothetical protein
MGCFEMMSSRMVHAFCSFARLVSTILLLERKDNKIIENFALDNILNIIRLNVKIMHPHYCKWKLDSILYCTVRRKVPHSMYYWFQSR